jgi:hypothetical protein
MEIAESERHIAHRSPSPVAGLVDSPIFPPSPTFESPLGSFSPIAQFSPLGARRVDGGSLPGLPPTAGSAVRFAGHKHPREVVVMRIVGCINSYKGFDARFVRRIDPHKVVGVRCEILRWCGLDSHIGDPAADAAVSAVCTPEEAQQAVHQVVQLMPGLGSRAKDLQLTNARLTDGCCLVQVRASLAAVATPAGEVPGSSPGDSSCCGSSAGSPVPSGAGFGTGPGAVSGRCRRRGAAQSLTFVPPSPVSVVGEEPVRLSLRPPFRSYAWLSVALLSFLFPPSRGCSRSVARLVHMALAAGGLCGLDTSLQRHDRGDHAGQGHRRHCWSCVCQQASASHVNVHLQGSEAASQLAAWAAVRLRPLAALAASAAGELSTVPSCRAHVLSQRAACSGTPLHPDPDNSRPGFAC